MEHTEKLKRFSKAKESMHHIIGSIKVYRESNPRPDALEVFNVTVTLMTRLLRAVDPDETQSSSLYYLKHIHQALKLPDQATYRLEKHKEFMNSADLLKSWKQFIDYQSASKETKQDDLLPMLFKLMEPLVEEVLSDVAALGQKTKLSYAIREQVICFALLLNKPAIAEQVFMAAERNQAEFVPMIESLRKTISQSHFFKNNEQKKQAEALLERWGNPYQHTKDTASAGSVYDVVVINGEAIDTLDPRFFAKDHLNYYCIHSSIADFESIKNMLGPNTHLLCECA